MQILHQSASSDDDEGMGGLVNKRKLPQNLQGNTGQKTHVKGGLITTTHNAGGAAAANDINSESML